MTTPTLDLSTLPNGAGIALRQMPQAQSAAQRPVVHVHPGQHHLRRLGELTDPVGHESVESIEAAEEQLAAVREQPPHRPAGPAAVAPAMLDVDGGPAGAD